MHRSLVITDQGVKKFILGKLISHSQKLSVWNFVFSFQTKQQITIKFLGCLGNFVAFKRTLFKGNQNCEKVALATL